jgi:ubiquinone/menaquinone biosynthesis C-methylase UbiE
MARGLPVIGADIPSTREIGGAALEYFSPHDDHALAKAITAVMGDADRYARQSSRALERSRHYSWAHAAEMNLAMIDQLLGKATQLGTAAHYESHPFEFMTDADAAQVESLQPPPFRRFVERYLHPGDTVADVGCGPGRATLYLLTKGCAVTAVDLTRQALSLTRDRGPEARFVQASNLALPFAAASFDAVVSDGVIHHTPDPFRALVENVRVLRGDGHLYLGVYKRNRYYYYVYTYVGRPVRWLEHRPWGRLLVNGTLLPVYYVAHLVKSRGKRTWRGAKNFFYDYIITPRATFHTREEVEEWGRRNGLELLEYHPNVGNVHAFFFRKA